MKIRPPLKALAFIRPRRRALPPAAKSTPAPPAPANLAAGFDMSQLQNSLAGITPGGAGLGALMGLPPGMNLEALQSMMSVSFPRRRLLARVWTGGRGSGRTNE